MSESVENTGGAELDGEAIYNQVYGNQQSHEAPAPQAAAPTPPAEPQYKEYAFSHRGQEIKVKENDPKFQQWLSQGYDYGTNVNSFRQEQEKFNQSRQEFEQTFAPYKEIDQYARQNPDWWAHVDQSYQQREQQGQQAISPEIQRYLDAKLEPISKDLPLMKEFLQEQQTQKLEKQRADEDAQLATSMKSLQEKYKGLDFSAKDESGLSLESRVLNHAVGNGFPTFRAAFLDYYHDSLEKQAEARGRESFQAEAQKRQKLGLLDENPTSLPRETPFAGKSKSWHDSSMSGDAIMRQFRF